MSHRLEQVQQQIHRLISEFLLKEGNFGIGIISINDILVSRDLSTVKIWVSFIAEKDQEQAFNQLLRHANQVQTFLYRNFPVKKVPKVVWQLDTKPDAAYRIEKLLDDIRPTTGTNPGSEESDANS
ncbi:MAG: ribosome-binding factor A [Patescibacteria group bacterium]|jgi:ribosome-binding factor A